MPRPFPGLLLVLLTIGGCARDPRGGAPTDSGRPPAALDGGLGRLDDGGPGFLDGGLSDGALDYDATEAGQLPALAGGDRCSVATELPEGTVHGTTVGSSDDYDTGGGPNQSNCLGRSLPGPDVAYEVNVPPRTRVVVELKPEPTFDPTVSLIRAGDFSDAELRCSSPAIGLQSACADDGDEGGAGMPERVETTNRSSDATESFFVLIDADAEGASGDFELSVDFQAIAAPPGETCDTAEAMTLPAAITGDLNGFEDDVFVDDGSFNGVESHCVAYSGPERVYRVEVPANQRLRVEVMPGTDRSGFVQVFLVDGNEGCASSARCAGFASPGASGASGAAFYDNSGSASKQLFVVVVADARRRDKTFRLEAELSPIPDPSGVGCDDAVPLAVPDRFREELVGAVRILGATACAPTYSRMLRVRVPPRSVVALNAALQEHADGHRIAVLDAPATSSCGFPGERQCLHWGSVTSQEPTNVFLSNWLHRPVDRFVAIGGDVAVPVVGETALRDLETVGRSCATPTRIASFPFAGDFDAAGGMNLMPGPIDRFDPEPGCHAGAVGNEHVFRATIPPDSTARFEVEAIGESAQGQRVPVLFLLEGGEAACHAPRPACAGRSFGGALSYTNEGVTERDVFVVVDWAPYRGTQFPRPGTGARFRLSAQIER